MTTKMKMQLIGGATAALLAIGATTLTLASESDAEGATCSRTETARLRALGQAGLDELLERHRALVDKVREQGEGALEADEARAFGRVRARIAAVAGQWHAFASGLYWQTDLEIARAEARRRGAPILSLRLLGELSEEHSCANSRLFRTLLYADPEVATTLREGFVLHWSSERPVPRVTVDYGDGRRLETTIAGNSIHYVLDASGRPIDAIAGLVHGRAFIEALGDALELHRAVAASPAEAERIVAEAHGERVARMAFVPGLEPEERAQTLAPTAAESIPLAIGKAAMELPMLAVPQGAIAGLDPLQLLRGPLAWAVDAELGRIAIPPRVRTLVAEKSRISLAASAAAASRDVEELATLRMLALTRSLALDTVQNRLVLGRRLSQRFAAGPQTLEALNTWVYAELFLTPRSDPWLGLVSPEIYTGLPGDGIVGPTAPERGTGGVTRSAAAQGSPSAAAAFR